MPRAAALAQNLALRLRIGIADAHAHQETVQLRFRQRIGAVVLHRILRRDHHERLRQRPGAAVDGHLHFVHGFEQRRLRLRRGAVDLVGQQKIREHRPWLEFEFLRVRVVDGDADHVAGQHVGGELEPLKFRAHAARQRMRQSSFADPRNIFNQQVPARQKTGERKTQHVRFSADGAAQHRLDFG